MEVGRGLRRITCRIGAAKPLYQHLIAGERTWLWVDTGIATTPDDYLVPYLDEHELTEPERVFAVVTHPDVDHFGGLARLRDRFRSLVAMAHRDDVPLIVDHDVLMSRRYLVHRERGVIPPDWRQQELLDRAGAESTVEVALSGGEVLDLDVAGHWEVLHLPGHSDGHIGVWDAAGRRMILGDAVLGWGVEDVDGNLVAPPPYYDLAAYLATIDRLERLGIGTLYTSHYPVMTGAEVSAFLASCRDAVKAIGAAVDAVGGADLTFAELCDHVGEALGRWPREAWPGLADPISAHLAAGAGAGR